MSPQICPENRSLLSNVTDHKGKIRRFEELVESMLGAGVTATIIMDISNNYEYIIEISAVIE